MPVDREREALDEMGATEVSVPIAGVVVAAFLVLTLVPGLAHLVRSPGPLVEKGAAIPMALVAKPTRPFEASRDTLQAIDGFEGELRNGSPLAAWVRPRVQGVFYDAAGVGNVQVVVGQDAPDTERSGPVLYFRPSVRHAMGEPFLDPERHDRVRRGGPAWESPPEPDPRPAVRQLADDLAMHGVELMVVPVPVKATVDHEPLGLAVPVDNPSWAPFREHLQRLGVDGPDALSVLQELEAPRFLETDTHWRPEAMDAVAASVARSLRERGVEGGRPLRRGEPVEHSAAGDLVDLLGMAEGKVAPDTVSVAPLQRRPDRADASVLVLGDSFAGIYEDPTLGFGDDGGFPDALAAHLGAPVDALVVNAGGAWQARQALADQVERLEHVDVVVWLFTARELSVGDWREVRLPVGAVEVDPRFVALDPGETRTLTGRIAAIAPAADPQGSPYPDQLVAVSVTVDGRAPGSPGSEAWGYAWGLRERQPQPAASARVGQSVTLQASSFADAPPQALPAGRSEAPGRPAAVPLLWLEWP